MIQSVVRLGFGPPRIGREIGGDASEVQHRLTARSVSLRLKYITRTALRPRTTRFTTPLLLYLRLTSEYRGRCNGKHLFCKKRKQLSLDGQHEETGIHPSLAIRQQLEGSISVDFLHVSTLGGFDPSQHILDRECPPTHNREL